MAMLKISPGNSKLGAIPSVSLPSVATCRTCGCNTKCYARKLERLRPTVAAAYQHNYEILQMSPETYWREVEGAIMMTRFFRFHVSGDIPSPEYFEKMVQVATRQQHCKILCFTKRFEIVNGFISQGGVIPDNLQILFSAWPGLEMQNPHGLPEAHVRFHRAGVSSTTAGESALECGGNCTECALTYGGCWSLKKGEQVVFDEH